MLRGLRGAKLFEGVRGRPPVDLPAAARVLTRLSEMAAELEGALAELDINPLIVTQDDALAVERTAQKEIPGYAQRREARKAAENAED